MCLRHMYENTPDIWLAEEGRWHLNEIFIDAETAEIYTEIVR